MEEEVKDVEAVENTEQQVKEQEKQVEKQEQPVEEAVEDTLPEGVRTVDEDGMVKIDLSKLNNQEDAVQEQETTSVDVDEQATDSEEVDTEIRSTEENEEQVIELIQEENEVKESTLAEKINNIPEKLKQEQEDVTNNQEIVEVI